MKVLVIEDEPFSAMATVAFFEDEGHSVAHVTSSDDALASLDTSVPDIVVSDWTIDGSHSAAVVAQKIRARNENVKLAFVTGHQFDRLEDDLKNLKPYSFYTKPVDLEKLVQDLTKV